MPAGSPAAAPAVGPAAGTAATEVSSVDPEASSGFGIIQKAGRSKPPFDHDVLRLSSVQNVDALRYLGKYKANDQCHRAMAKKPSNRYERRRALPTVPAV